MNLLDKLKYILTFLLAVNILITAKDDCKAKVHIGCDITNVILNVNGISYNQSDHFTLSLEKGNYKFTLTENSDRLDAKTISDTIEIVDCAEKNLYYKFKEEVYLDTNPQDAKIIYGDSLIGYTPSFINKNLSSLLISKDGYDSISLSTNKLEDKNIIDLNFIGRMKEESFFEKVEFELVIGAIAILGGVTAYYKLLADDNFEEYQLTGNQSSLDLTKKYDLISGISFGLLQLNFGYLLYNIFAD